MEPGVRGSGEREEGIVQNWPRKRWLPKENMNKKEHGIKGHIKLGYMDPTCIQPLHSIRDDVLTSQQKSSEGCITGRCNYAHLQVPTVAAVGALFGQTLSPLPTTVPCMDLESLWAFGIGFFVKTQPNLSSSAEIALIGHTNVWLEKQRRWYLVYD